MVRHPAFAFAWLLLPFFSACAAVSPAAGPFLAADDARAMAVASTSPPPSAPAQAAGRKGENHVDVMIGGSYWNGLGDLETSGTGPVVGAIDDFDSWGWAFDLGYDRVVWSGREGEWTLGLETGWSTFDSDSLGYYTAYSEITGNMWYLAPTTRWHFALSPRTTLVAGIGAGYYGFSIDELSTYYYGWWWGYDSRTLNQDDAFGGFASLAMDFETSPGGAFRIESKAHFVEFGGLDALLPNERSVSGPIWNFELGYVFKF